MNEHDALHQVAIDWFHRLRSDMLTDGEREEFAHWLSASPRHAVIFDEITATWAELGHFEEALRMQYAVAAQQEPGAQRFKRFSFLKLRPLALAASLLLGGVLLFAALRDRHVVATGRGDQLTTTLGDGSIIHLNAKSRVKVDFTAGTRGVTLEEGDAVFEVAHDAQRPFIVTAGAAQIRAIGTAFNVSRRENGGAVTVVEGTVQVTSVPAAGSPALSQPMKLTQGEHTAYATDGALSPVTHVNAEEAMAWRQRKLIFDRTPLHTVIDEFNRFGTTILVIGDTQLQSLRITGTFDADNAETLVESLNYMSGLRVVRVGRQMTIFYLSDHQ